MTDFDQLASRILAGGSATEANALACTWKDAKEGGEEFQLMTISSRNWLSKYAVQYAVAEASGGTPPALKDKGSITLGIWEDSAGGKEPKCDESFGPETYFSNEMSEQEMNEIALEQ